MVAHKSVDCVGCNVAKTLVESVDVDLFDRSGVNCGIRVFNFEKSIRVGRNAADLLACWV